MYLIYNPKKTSLSAPKFNSSALAICSHGQLSHWILMANHLSELMTCCRLPDIRNHVLVLLSLLFSWPSCVRLFATAWTAARHAFLPFTIPWVCSNSCPLSQWCHPAVLPDSVTIFSSCPLSFPASRCFPVSWHFTWGGQCIGVQLQHHSFQWIFKVDFLQDWLVWSCCSRNSQESSPTPQFISISSSVLSFLYGPTLTSIRDSWKKKKT